MIQSLPSVQEASSRVKAALPVVVKWALFLFFLFACHFVVAEAHHRHCRRTIFHVLFWKQSTFCTTLDTMASAIEGLFDMSLGKTQSLVLSVIKLAS